MPAWISCSITVSDSVAGPMVATIFVAFGCVLIVSIIQRLTVLLKWKIMLVVNNIKDLMIAQTKTGQDLVEEALASTDSGVALDEIVESDNLADSLTHLQSVIERNALESEKIAADLKLKRESLRSVYENDARLSAVEDEAQQKSQLVKEEKARLLASPQTVAIRTSIAELTAQKKELEETLSNHLLNYFQLTNSKSFDTSDGDQWEFSVAAKVKTRKK